MAKKRFKTHVEAWQAADKDSPIGIDLLNRVREMHNTPLETKEDFRFFVLFNHIRAIHRSLNRTVDDTFLQRIQDNILYSAEKHLE